MTRPEEETETSFLSDFDPAAARRGGLRVLAVVIVVCLIVAVMPGLGELRDRLEDADPIWLAIAVVLEGLSGLSYVLMLKPIFLPAGSWWTAQRLGWSELAMGSIMPSSGVAGLVLGGWVLGRAGMEPHAIARRSVAFYLIKGVVNFVAVAVLGFLMFAGVGPPRSDWLTLFPALAAVAVMALVVLIPLIGPGGALPGADQRLRRMVAVGRRTLVRAVGEAGAILRQGHPAVYAGAIGYWFFDNAVIWAAFRAFGEEPALTVVLMAYLLGQLGGLLPLPGGVGGVDGGLVGAYVLYGEAAGTTVLAVLTYRLILFWLPLGIGALGFWSLQRRLAQLESDALADPGELLVEPEFRPRD